MTVRQFSVQPCPTCKADTTHYVMKCRECGHVNETPTEVRQRANDRLFAGRRYRTVFGAKSLDAAHRRKPLREIPLRAERKR